MAELLNVDDPVLLLALAMFYSYLLLVSELFRWMSVKLKGQPPSKVEKVREQLHILGVTFQVFGRLGAVAVGLVLLFQLPTVGACLLPIFLFWMLLPIARHLKMAPQ